MHHLFGGAFCVGMALLLVSRAPVRGVIDNWTFYGIITQGLASGPYQVNVPYSMRFAIDSTRLTPSASGLYLPTVGYYFNAGSGGVGASSTGSGVLVANDQSRSGGGSFDGIIFSMFGEGLSDTAPFDGTVDGITLVNASAGSTATPFTGMSFPSALDLNQFTQRYMSLGFQGGTVKGTVNSFYINGVLISQVPEPGPLTLLAAGGALLVCGRIHRRKAGDVC
ncbi:MAG TPA: hypothetical protein VMB80_10300 [Candidatus Acidoferrum sp.]|nr:hypothetical protein [Candidatus Acidoferrum sp.]